MTQAFIGSRMVEMDTWRGSVVQLHPPGKIPLHIFPPNRTYHEPLNSCHCHPVVIGEHSDCIVWCHHG